MRAEELRIGNWVKQNPEFDWYKPFQVESIGKEGINIEPADDGKPYGMHCAILDYEFKFEELFGVELTEEWLLRFGFVQKQPYGWHGNGYDYQIPAIEGGSTTEYHDFVIYNVLGDLDFIVRFSSYKYGSNIEDEDKSISFHLCEWREKCANEVICFDTTKIHFLQNAFYQSLGSELELKSLPETTTK